MSVDLPKRLLEEVSNSARAWHLFEESARHALQVTSLYLGGDGLRPYLLYEREDEFHYIGKLDSKLPLPPAMQWLLNVQHQNFEGEYLNGRIGDFDDRLRGRFLKVPRVHLVQLADNARYQSLRLPLGVARLAQWLRFTNVARVQVTDYTTDRHPLRNLEVALSQTRPEVLGVSVNFGQRALCEELAALIKQLNYDGLVVLGNILPAKSPEGFAEIFAPIPIRIATSLGEIPLEKLCENVRIGHAHRSVDGLIEMRSMPTRIVQHVESMKPEFVFPDDGMTRAILDADGQLALETSIGCNYGKCTFCPRDHRGRGWSRLSTSTVVAALHRIARLSKGKDPTVSFVDEEFFGAEGLLNTSESNAAVILDTCMELGIKCELYTRAEQLFSSRRPLEWNQRRARMLAAYSSCIRRLFIGVESGSSSQLKRYGKGQSPKDIVDALRIGSLLGIAMEFGFITFDPLLSAEELLENLEFLNRRDVFLRPSVDFVEISNIVAATVEGKQQAGFDDALLFDRVAYLATELEVLVDSPYARMLTQNYPHLLQGGTDLNFARLNVSYADERIGAIANLCRCWTEGMFAVVYKERIRMRTERLDQHSASAKLLSAYRRATMKLLRLATQAYIVESKANGLARPETQLESFAQRWSPELEKLALSCIAVTERPISIARIRFDLSSPSERRKS